VASSVLRAARPSRPIGQVIAWSPARSANHSLSQTCRSPIGCILPRVVTDDAARRRKERSSGRDTRFKTTRAQIGAWSRFRAALEGGRSAPGVVLMERVTATQQAAPGPHGIGAQATSQPSYRPSKYAPVREDDPRTAARQRRSIGRSSLPKRAWRTRHVAGRHQT